MVDLEVASKPSQTFRGTNHKLIPHRSTPTAYESPTSKSNKIKGEMLKTCSNHEFLWSREGEGVDLHLSGISLKNSHKSLRDLRFEVGERRGSFSSSVGQDSCVAQPLHEVVKAYL